LDDNGKLTIKLDRYPITANAYGSRYEDELTMRILLPKKSYDAIAITGDRLHAAFYQCKGKQLTANVAYGSILLQKADLQKADLLSNTSEITVQRSRISYLDIENQAGDTKLLQNQLRYWKYTSRWGNLDAQTQKISGIWELNSRWGNIHIDTKKWHNNLLLDLHSDKGIITASSKQKPWKKTIPRTLTAHDLLLLEGHGDNILYVRSEEGNISIE
jgi:hypothetical protein